MTFKFLRDDGQFAPFGTAAPSTSGGPVTILTNATTIDITLSSTAAFFDGPSVSQGTSGTWFAAGTVTLVVNNASASTNEVICKLWDGTTVMATAVSALTAISDTTVSLAGFITSPAGNIRISCNSPAATNNKILFNLSGLSKDSNITAVRLG